MVYLIEGDYRSLFVIAQQYGRLHRYASFFNLNKFYGELNSTISYSHSASRRWHIIQIDFIQLSTWRETNGLKGNLSLWRLLVSKSHSHANYHNNRFHGHCFLKYWRNKLQRCIRFDSFPATFTMELQSSIRSFQEDSCHVLKASESFERRTERSDYIRSLIH